MNSAKLIKTNVYEGLNTNFSHVDSWGNWRRRVNLEASTRCNLLCPGCNRTQTRGQFAITDLDIENFKLLVRPENNLQGLTYNMALSDPIYSGTLFEQLEYLLTLKQRPQLHFSTNGSGRNAQWWEQFATYLQNTDMVEFAVDGLKDTNHIYRVNAKWESILLGIRTLREHFNGKITWRYLVFEHNYHQVAQAQRFATELNLDNFNVILGDDRTPKEMILHSKTWKQVLNDLS